MDDQEFIEHQYSLLATYRRNLRIILEQAAQHGGEALAPLELANQLHIQRTCIAQVKATLRDLGVIVDEYENEQPPKADAEPPRRPPKHNLANPGYREFIARPRYQQALVEWLSNRYPIMLVSGLGGSGKSSLVYETVYRAVSSDPATPQFEAAVWVSDKGSQGTTLAGLLDEIALTLGHRGLTQLDDSVKRREIEHLLRTCKTLLVIDNFETIRDRQLYPWLKQKLPTPSKAIITSRSRNNLAGYDLIELEGMTEDEARAFLHQQTHQFEHTRTLAPAQIDGLIAAAGGNPKVMDVALQMLLHDRRAYTAVIDDLRQARGDLFDDLFASVWATLSKEAQTVLMAATLFVKHARADALAASANLHADVFDQVRLQLHNQALLDELKPAAGTLYDDETRRFSLHQLVRSYALQHVKRQKSWANGARRRLTRWSAEYLGRYGWDWKQPERLRQLAPDEPELYALLAASVPHDDRTTLALCQGLDHYYYVEGHWDKKRQADRWRIEAAHRLGQTNEEARSIAQYIQFLCRQQELDEAQSYAERLSALLQQGGHSADVLVQSQHAFAFLAIARQEYTQALDILDRCDTILLSKAEINIAIATHHWQAYCRYKLGRFEQAQQLFHQTMDEALREQYRRSAVFCRLHLAKIAVVQGDADAAMPLLEQSLREATAIDEQRYIAQIKLSFARLAIQRREVEPAQAMLSQADRLYKKLRLFDDYDLLLQTHTELQALVALH